MNQVQKKRLKQRAAGSWVSHPICTTRLNQSKTDGEGRATARKCGDASIIRRAPALVLQKRGDSQVTLKAKEEQKRMAKSSTDETANARLFWPNR